LALLRCNHRVLSCHLFELNDICGKITPLTIAPQQDWSESDPAERNMNWRNETLSRVAGHGIE
jgi:hypothetical protein